MSAEKNLNLKKTSFLSKTNSSFIEQMYIKYINEDASLPDSWKNYFQELNEDTSSILKDIKGPSWSKNNDYLIKKKINSTDFEKEKI